MTRNNKTYYYHRDSLGSIASLTDETGNIVQEYRYDSFGNITYIKDPNFLQPFTFTGREYDSESNTYYYRERILDANSGTFISADPIGFGAGDVNLFRYVGNRPTRYVDPYGLVWGGGGIEGGIFLPFGGVEGSIDIVNDDSGNVALVMTICSGIGKTQGLSWFKKLIGGSFGFGPIMGEGTLKEGVSDSYGGSVGVGLGGYGGIDTTTDQKSGEVVGDFRVGVGAGFYASGIGCKTKTIILNNKHKKKVKQCDLKDSP